MHLLQNRVQLHALVNTAMNTLIPKLQRKFLTAKETLKFLNGTAGRMLPALTNTSVNSPRLCQWQRAVAKQTLTYAVQTESRCPSTPRSTRSHVCGLHRPREPFSRLSNTPFNTLLSPHCAVSTLTAPSDLVSLTNQMNQQSEPQAGSHHFPAKMIGNAKKFLAMGVNSIPNWLDIILDSITNYISIIFLSSSLTLRWLMSYIYGAPILDVSRSHTTTQHSR